MLVQEFVHTYELWNFSGTPSVTDWFPSHRVSNVERTSMSWLFHDRKRTVHGIPLKDCYGKSNFVSGQNFTLGNHRINATDILLTWGLYVCMDTTDWLWRPRNGAINDEMATLLGTYVGDVYLLRMGNTGVLATMVWQLFVQLWRFSLNNCVWKLIMLQLKMLIQI